MPADYDGDRKADLAVKRDDGYWRIDYSRQRLRQLRRGDPLGPEERPRARCPPTTTATARPTSRVRVDCGPWFIDYAANGFGGLEQRFDHMTARDVVRP